MSCIYQNDHKLQWIHPKMVKTLNSLLDYDLGLRFSLSHDTRFKSSLLVYSNSEPAPRGVLGFVSV